MSRSLDNSMPRPDAVRSMRERWERYASTDPHFYIDCAPPGTTPDEFYTGASELALETLEWIGPDVNRSRFLEIGCGLGRMVRHFAGHFERVDGVDISAEMIARAKNADLPSNVVMHLGTGADLHVFEQETFDVVFSSQVFQHIAEGWVIEAYVREVARVLRPRGRAVLQFDSRVNSLGSRLYFTLPERLRLRRHRNFIRRYRRDPAWLRSIATSAGLRVIEERGIGTTVHWLLLTTAVDCDSCA